MAAPAPHSPKMDTIEEGKDAADISHSRSAAAENETGTTATSIEANTQEFDIDVYADMKSPAPKNVSEAPPPKETATQDQTFIHPDRRDLMAMTQDSSHEATKHPSEQPEDNTDNWRGSRNAVRALNHRINRRPSRRTPPSQSSDRGRSPTRRRSSRSRSPRNSNHQPLSGRSTSRDEQYQDRDRHRQEESARDQSHHQESPRNSRRPLPDHSTSRWHSLATGRSARDDTDRGRMNTTENRGRRITAADLGPEDLLDGRSTYHERINSLDKNGSTPNPNRYPPTTGFRSSNSRENLMDLMNAAPRRTESSHETSRRNDEFPRDNSTSSSHGLRPTTGFRSLNARDDELNAAPRRHDSRERMPPPAAPARPVGPSDRRDSHPDSSGYQEDNRRTETARGNDDLPRIAHGLEPNPYARLPPRNFSPSPGNRQNTEDRDRNAGRTESDGSQRRHGSRERMAPPPVPRAQPVEPGTPRDGYASSGGSQDGDHRTEAQRSSRNQEDQSRNRRDRSHDSRDRSEAPDLFDSRNRVTYSSSRSPFDNSMLSSLPSFDRGYNRGTTRSTYSDRSRDQRSRSPSRSSGGRGQETMRIRGIADDQREDSRAYSRGGQTRSYEGSSRNDRDRSRERAGSSAYRRR